MGSGGTLAGVIFSALDRGAAVHASSYEKVDAFVRTYLGDFRDQPLTILDVGSQIVVNQPLSYKPLFDAPTWNYTGLDVEAGVNVDVVPADPYRWDELAADTFDIVVSGQAFEHIPYFWATAFEIGRVMRPGGLAVIIAPGRGPQHRFPVDCWRFHDDGFQAVADYLGFEVLDVFTEWGRNMWDESIVVMRKPVWLLENRQRFASRLAYQRAVSANDSSPTDAPNSAATTTESEPPAPSPLQIVVGGILTERLEQLRLQALERRAQRVNASLPSWRRAIPLRLRKKVANVLMPPPPNPWDFD